MVAELGAVFLASLLGSWHCAGMCGPFGVLLKNAREPGLAQVGYHLGRLASYWTLSLGLSFLTRPFRLFLGQWVFIGILVVWGLLFLKESQWLIIKPPRWLSRITRSLASTGSAWAAAGLGVSTGLIPCGWLYGFIIVSGSQSDLTWTALTVLVFWAGTLPALGLSVFFLRGLGERFRRRSRVWSMALLVISGLISLLVRKP